MNEIYEQFDIDLSVPKNIRVQFDYIVFPEWRLMWGLMYTSKYWVSEEFKIILINKTEFKQSENTATRVAGILAGII